MNLTVRFAALVVLATSVTAQNVCARNYTVQLGDFCDSISAAQNVSTFQLAHVNADKLDAECANLVQGESLCLGIVGQDCNTTTVVRSGDLCTIIAAETGIDFTLLLQNNPNINGGCTNIYPGEVLCTANEVINYI